MRVLLLCSQAKVRSRLADALRFEGASVMEAVRPHKIVELAQAEQPDLIILDDPDAERIAQSLRARFATVPIALGMEVVRPCAAATYVWPSPLETAPVVSLVNQTIRKTVTLA